MPDTETKKSPTAGLPKTEVTVAPGWSMHDASEDGVTTQQFPLGNGTFEDRVVDVQTRRVKPGEKIKVFTKDVPKLVAMGTILPPKV